MNGTDISETEESVVLKNADTEKNILFVTKIGDSIVVSNGYYIKKDNGVVGISTDGVYWNVINIPLLTTVKDVYIFDNKLIITTSDVSFKYDISELKQHTQTYIEVNNQILGFDTAPVIESDRTLVPLRFIFETLGADVDWEAATQTAVVKNDDTVINFSIDKKTAMVNDTAKTMDVPARLIDSKTLVPLRFLSESLGYNVEWNEETRTATISK